MIRYEKKFLLCPPHHYSISYEINPWMDTKNGSYKNRAVEQWSSLLSAIIQCDGFFDVIEPREGLPDMVFSANAGLPLFNSKTIILSNFAHKERQGEQEWWEEYFRSCGWKTFMPQSPFEGAGDALYMNNHLICGYGFRTKKEVYGEISKQFGSIPIIVKLQDPRFYHLDTCFCPLKDMDYLYYTGAFDQEAIEKFRSLTGNNGISVPEEEAVHFACNAVCIGNHVIIPEGCPVTKRALQEHGYVPHPIPMSEYIKSGGACKCLTLAI